METNDVRRKNRARSETQRTWAFVRSTAESGCALLARSIHTTSNPASSHAVPRPFRSPLTPCPPPAPPSIPFRKTPTIVGLDARDRCRLALQVLSRRPLFAIRASLATGKTDSARKSSFSFFFSLSLCLFSLLPVSFDRRLCSPRVRVSLSFRRITTGLNLDRVRTARYVCLGT